MEVDEGGGAVLVVGWEAMTLERYVGLLYGGVGMRTRMRMILGLGSITMIYGYGEETR